MKENVTPTPGKKPWYARLRGEPNETVTTIRTLHPEEKVPEGFTRDVALSLIINEPGKGSGPTVPRREILTPMHSDDAFTLGLHLIEEAISVEQRNAKEGVGGGRKRWWKRVLGDEKRRMPAYYAEGNELAVGAIRARLKHWEREHPNIADYRVSGALHHLEQALRYMRYLSQDATPDLDVARRELAEKGFFDAEPGEQPVRQTLTGHAATDHPAERGLVPRLRAHGTYHETSSRDIRVQVMGVSTSSVVVVPVGKSDDDGIEIPRNPSDLLTLTLDNDTDWIDPSEAETRRGKVPRMLAYGKYYITTANAIPVQVMGLSTDYVLLQAVGTAAQEHPEPIKAPREEMGTWLELDNQDDWRDTDDEALEGWQ